MAIFLHVLSCLGLASVLLSVSLGVAECRKGNRRRGNKARGRKATKKNDDDVKKRRGPQGKLEEVIKNCKLRPPLPPYHRLGGIPPDATSEPPESWWYLRRVPDLQHNGGVRIEKVDWTIARAALCEEVFLGRTSPFKRDHEQSITTCMLSLEGDGITEQALFVSDYNKERGLPNFVAFVVPVNSSGQWTTEQDPTSAMAGFDVAYSPGSHEVCCWCDPDHSRYREHTDVACKEPVGKNGLLVPLSAFESTHMDAANVFLNAVPTRLNLTEQWTRRLKNVFAMAQRLHHRERRMHVLIGPSVESDGHLPAESSESASEGNGIDTGRTIDVPSFLWTAYGDPYAISGGGFSCRNGGPDDECACADTLTLSDLEQRLGVRLFPGMHATPAYIAVSDHEPYSVYSCVFLGLGVLAVVITMMCVVIIWTEDTPDKVRYAKMRKKRRMEENNSVAPASPAYGLRSKLESVARERSRRKSLENALGGKEALQERFRAI